MDHMLVRHAVVYVVTLSAATISSTHVLAVYATETHKRLSADIHFLTADAAREVRGVGRKGLDKAADYIAAQFSHCGLATTSYEGTPFQRFVAAIVVKMGSNNNLVLVGPPDKRGKPQRTELVLGTDYTPLAIGGSGKIDAPVVFAGYGITDLAKNYDDFAGLNVDGKTVITFMGFDRADIATMHQERMKRLLELNASAMIFVSNDTLSCQYVAAYRAALNDRFEQLKKDLGAFRKMVDPTPEQTKSQLEQLQDSMQSVVEYQDRLRDALELRLSFDSAGWNELDPGYPVMRFRRSIIDPILISVAGSNLKTREREIAVGGKPNSEVLVGWSIVGEVEVIRQVIEEKNVIAVLEGAGSLADESVILGAHYDVRVLPEAPLPCRQPFDYPTFLGNSLDGILSGNVPQPIYQGANDNASGVAVLLEVARGLAPLNQEPRRRVVFIAFAGEEIGMVGSKTYVRNPLVPLEKTVAMVNLDMVGRLEKDKLIAIGAKPPGLFSELLDQLNHRHGFQIEKARANQWSGDQAAFHAKRIPTMWLGTGPDETINTPEDRPERLNIDGMKRIAEMVTEFVTALAVNSKRPEYIE